MRRNPWVAATGLLGALCLAEALVIGALWTGAAADSVPTPSPAAPSQGAVDAFAALEAAPAAEEPANPESPPPTEAPLPLSRAVPKVESVVETLSHPSFAGRMVGTPGEAAAAAQIAAWFDAIDLPPPPRAKRTEPFAFTWEGAEYRSAGNVLAYSDADAPWTVIIGAHYDHIGLGHSMSREYFNEAIHPGADDNASGIAAMLEVARTVATEKRSLRVNLLFVAFSGEEEGLFGADAFLKSPAFDAAHALAYINYDMVGRADPGHPIVEVEGPVEFPPFEKLLADLPKPPFTLTTRPSRSADGTDRMAFLRAGFPALSFSSGIHDDYHKSTDTVDRVNPEGIRAVARYTLALVDALGGYPQGFDRSKVVREFQRPGSAP